MIGWLRGVLRHRASDRIIVDCGGVGYELTIPLGVVADVAVGEMAELFVHTHVREDHILLYGFEDLAQRAAFEVLTGVTGVGPKLAVSTLGELGLAELVRAVESDDVARLKKVSGIGKRLAERLSLELRGKLLQLGGVDVVPASAPRAGVKRVAAGDVWADLESALSNLQFRPVEVSSALALVRQEQPETTDFDTLLRASLQTLRR